MRLTAVFPIHDLPAWKKRLLHWAAGHELAAYLDSNGYEPNFPKVESPQSGGEVAPGRPGTANNWECLAAAGAIRFLETNAGQSFPLLAKFRQEAQNDWLFGFFGYDLKNEVERLSSHHFDGIGLPDLGFFQPETVAGIRQKVPGDPSFFLEIQTMNRKPEEVFREIVTSEKPQKANPEPGKIHLQPRMSKPEYLQTVEAIRQHIIEGDVYEMNLCQEFYAENAIIDPVNVFERLNKIGQSPFATFLRWRDRYLLSVSPERFLKKQGQYLITQPIKGTRRRGRSAPEDEQIRQELANSEKDRAENVMIVDLVRNDLSRHCLPGSVRVDELFGIYTFETVHQMISTVSGVLKNDPPAVVGTLAGKNDAIANDAVTISALRDAFPPGSMTGAPKVMAMELIERYEHTRRGLYSGAFGYFDPGGNFDFNVVIRSILYNAADRYTSVQVGGAIVFDSEAEQEYEECLVKAEAMMRALENKVHIKVLVAEEDEKSLEKRKKM